MPDVQAKQSKARKEPLPCPFQFRPFSVTKFGTGGIGGEGVKHVPDTRVCGTERGQGTGTHLLPQHHS